ncbi:hypothetical protein ABZS66_15625 [Dactylosporangium sp. NPDC005572]|uniref:hypothetical protein n=1 Tax=Dactylosporangium sp. NPDC005572 TaxID=3156889 RepID=UPI0033B53D4D
MTRLPRWALSIAAAGCAFIAVQAWTYCTAGFLGGVALAWIARSARPPVAE